MERTLAALPRLLGAGKGGQQRQPPPSRGLVALKNAVDNARGRSEQDAVVRQSTYQRFVLAWSLSAVAGDQITVRMLTTAGGAFITASANPVYLW